jgi:hypothetical protein
MKKPAVAKRILCGIVIELRRRVEVEASTGIEPVYTDLQS